MLLASPLDFTKTYSLWCYFNQAILAYELCLLDECEMAFNYQIILLPQLSCTKVPVVSSRSQYKPQNPLLSKFSLVLYSLLHVQLT